MGARIVLLLAFQLPFSAAAQPVVWSSMVGGNDHAYEFIAGPTSWSAAQAAAASLTHDGQSGYLATIASAAENDFLLASFGGSASGSAWIGASDSALEGEWRWVAGPETGVQFWQGDEAGTVTPPLDFANWGGTEPNDFPSGDPTNEDFAVFALVALSGFILAGDWADANDGGTNANIVGYLVEFDPVPATPALGPGGLTLVSAALLALGARALRTHRPTRRFG